MSSIPIYSHDGRLIRFEPEDHIRRHAYHFRLVENRRGHLKRAYMRPIESLDRRPNSTMGIAFEQQLTVGRVWALRGVRGSDR